MASFHTTLRDTVLQGLRMGQVVRVEGYGGARCTVTGWAAGHPWSGDTVEVRVESFDAWGRVVSVDHVDVARAAVTA